MHCSRARLLLAALVAATLLAGGCAGDDDDASAPPTTEAATGEDGDEEGEARGGGDEPATTATSQAAVAALPRSQDLDLQANHPNGTVLRVTRVDFTEDAIVVKVTAINGSPERDVELADYGVDLTDDLGTRYRLSPPTSNPDLRVARATTLDATLAFLGRIAPKATKLSLRTNTRISGDTNELTSTPTVTISDIPVQR